MTPERLADLMAVLLSCEGCREAATDLILHLDQTISRAERAEGRVEDLTRELEETCAALEKLADAPKPIVGRVWKSSAKPGDGT